MQEQDIDSRRAVRVLAGAAIAILGAMVAISLTTGVSQEQFEMVRPGYRDAMVRAAPVLRVLISLDTLFIVAYAAFFFVFVRAVGVAGVGVVRLGVGAMLATAGLDMIEDHHLLALARIAEGTAALDEATLRFQHVLSQVKFHISYLALVLVALGLPRRTPLERTFAWALGAPLPVLGALLWAVPALEPTLDVARWLAFLGGFAGALVVLRR